MTNITIATRGVRAPEVMAKIYGVDSQTVLNAIKTGELETLDDGSIRASTFRMWGRTHKIACKQHFCKKCGQLKSAFDFAINRGARIYSCCLACDADKKDELMDGIQGNIFAVDDKLEGEEVFCKKNEQLAKLFDDYKLTYDEQYKMCKYFGVDMRGGIETQKDYDADIEDFRRGLLLLGFCKCPKCGRLLRAEQFYEDRSKPTGHSYYCKNCSNTQKQVREEKNKKREEIKRLARLYGFSVEIKNLPNN